MMQTIAAFHFIRPWWLLLLLPALFLWWRERREADTTARWRAVMDGPLLAALSVGGAQKRRIGPEDLLLTAWIIGVVAVAGPTWRLLPSPFAPSARPAMFVLKVTPSMLERDLPPSRLDRAREKMSDLLSARQGAPTGLIAYAGSAHLVLPPTPDTAVLNSMATALSPDIMPRQGDALADALALAQRTLADAGQGGSIVVFADTAPTIAARPSGNAPVVLFATLPPLRAQADASLLAATQALGARLVAPTIDGADVAALAARLATAGAPPPVPGEAPRWMEAGWWLTPLLALLVLLWFRRGWVLA
ncbi:transporter [Azorhizobium oxalatiphilum]|uniref:Transporter n=1 Tax=Azorhizobium oxalatiphilum TaxID=980631 RepID=A0A917BVB5_9HYPH|nr:VWA domain-containing protein [Azorhizobium oxalatiphilum]GGF58730.1 transporter [Azorhizobium oxalatiphilum]